MNKPKRIPYNNLVASLNETADALNIAEAVIQSSLKTNFSTTIKHRQQRDIALDIRNGAVLRLLSAIRKEFNV